MREFTLGDEEKGSPNQIDYAQAFNDEIDKNSSISVDSNLAKTPEQRPTLEQIGSQLGIDSGGKRQSGLDTAAQ